jgi:hypothetical protein
MSMIAQVAEKGWLLLPEYKFSLRTGEWRHESRLTRFPERQWLSSMTFPDTEPPRQATGKGSIAVDAQSYESSLQRQLEEAGALFARLEACLQLNDHSPIVLIWHRLGYTHIEFSYVFVHNGC